MSRVQGKDAADKWLASRPNAAEVTAKINASSGYTAAAVKDLEEKLKNTNLKIGERGSAFSKLIEFCIEKADLQKLNEYLNTWIPVFQKESPKDLPRFLSNTCHWYTIKNLSSHPAFLEQYTTRLLEFNSGNLTFWEGKLTAQKALNDVNGQIKTVNDILNSVNLNAEKKLFYQSVKTVYDSDSGESAAKKITELVKNAEDEKLRTSKKTADLL